MNNNAPVQNSPASNTGNVKKRKKIKRKRVGFLVPVVLGLTIAIVGVCALYTWNMLQNSENPFFGEYEEVSLPNFEGMTLDEAKTTLKRSPLNYIRVQYSEEQNMNYPAGTVISQNPTSDNNSMRKVKANQRLYLVVSAGVQTAEVPDLIGMSRQTAITTLLEKNLIPHAVLVDAPGVSPGTVISTSPEKGTMLQADKNAIVKVNVAGNFSHYDKQVPSVVGAASTEEAANILEVAGLSLGLVENELTVEYPPGAIINQSPKPGTVLRVGGEVRVTVAEAPPPEPEPEYIPPPAPQVPVGSTPTEVTPPAETPPAETPPAETPPAETPPADGGGG